MVNRLSGCIKRSGNGPSEGPVGAPGASIDAKGPSATKPKDVTFPMNKNLSTEVAGAIADALRETATQPQGDASQGGAPPSQGSSKPNRPASRVLLFVADLLSNSALSRFLGAGRPEAAMLRGSLVGLASGVEAITNSTPSDGATKRRPLGAIMTVSAYVVGGIAVALIFRALRRGEERTIPTEM